MENFVFVSREFGWFLGEFDNNLFHKHYAIQISIPLEAKIQFETSNCIIETELPVLIRSNVRHRVGKNSRQLLILINPASKLGHTWSHFTTNEIATINSEQVEQIKKVLTENNSTDFTHSINQLIKSMHCSCEMTAISSDDRILSAIQYLEENSDRIVSLEEISDHCHLSTSRFLHLFKQETGITFRRAQSWNKLISGLPYFGKNTLTEIAHQVGFSDSAHFSRTFKENFGVGPRDFISNSQFIQV